MSDGDIAFMNAMKKVFLSVQYHIFCHWHVDRNCQKNVRIKIADKELGKILFY